MLYIYADCSNLYYCGRNRYGRKLDYRKVIDFLTPFGEVKKKVAYGSTMKNEAAGFITALKSQGWECNFKSPKTYTHGDGIKRKADWDVGIAVDMLEDGAGPGDMAVLLSADGDMLPALQTLLTRGVDVLVMGFDISAEISASCKSIEIPPSLMED